MAAVALTALVVIALVVIAVALDAVALDAVALAAVSRFGCGCCMIYIVNLNQPIQSNQSF